MKIYLSDLHESFDCNIFNSLDKAKQDVIKLFDVKETDTVKWVEKIRGNDRIWCIQINDDNPSEIQIIEREVL